MNISKITVGRLFNLGNYEHVRYELTVDVRPGEAAVAIVGVEKLLHALNPRRPAGVLPDDEITRTRARIAQIREMTDEEVRRQCGVSKYGYIVKNTQALAEAEAKVQAWKARATAARELFDNLGGAAICTDAKLDWQDNEFGGDQ